MAEQPVRIAGLTSLRRDLKRAEAYEEIAEIGAAFGEASELVRAAASSKASSTGRRVDELLAATYKVTKSKVRAQLKIGASDKPYLIGQEWGAHHDKPRPVRNGNRTTVRGWNQFPEVQRGGRFVYPAAADKSEQIIDLVANRIVKVLTAGGDDEGEP